MGKKCPPPITEDKRLKKGQHCSQHSVDVGVHFWQDRKRVAMCLMYHKSEMDSKVDKAN
jgi:hypothetical protein